MTRGDDERRFLVRAGFFTGLTVFLFAALLFRFFALMVTRHEELSGVAAGQRSTSRELWALRGTIRDRHGREVALTRAVPSVAVDPAAVAPEDREAVAAHLAKVLGLPRRFVREQLGKDARFRWLARHITDPRTAARLPELDPAFATVREELYRSYPAGRAAAQLVGFTDVDGRGLTGLELALDRLLAPRFGREALVRDGRAGLMKFARGPDGSTRPGRDGVDVVLAMDLTVQTFVEEALDRAVEEWKPASATAIVLDPRNGDVLALASRPTFDPGDYRRARPEATKCRAVTDSYEFGSTIKPLIAAAALDEVVASLGDRFDCTHDGSWRIGRRTLHDHKPLGVLSFRDVIVKSSNIGIAQIGLRLGCERTYRLVRSLGFGRSTGSGLPGEVEGTVTAREKWTEAYTLASVSMGHELTATPLQFVAAFATLANDGVLFRPRVALRVGDREIPVRAERQVFSRAVARGAMPDLLEGVVNEGTGTKAKVPGYRVGGKTGTAQVLKRGGVDGYVSSFVGIAPLEDPRFVVLVVLERPRRDKGTPYGGSCAAPCVGEILARCLGYAEIPPTVPAAADPHRIEARLSR